MLRRVTSRERFVSWDAFDAKRLEAPATTTTGESDTETETSSVADDGSCDGCDLLKQRKRSFSSFRVEKVEGVNKDQAAESSEIEKALSSSVGLDSLPDEIQLSIASFLSMSDTRSALQVNSGLRRLIASSETLWQEHCKREWPSLNTSFALVETTTPPHLLLSLAKTEATKIDQVVLKQTVRRVQRRERQLFGAAAAREDLHLVTAQKQDGSRVLCAHYSGQVGDENRCVRANKPFPKLTRTNYGHFMRMRKRGTYRPFVSPFLTNDGKACLTPRLTAYYEVSVLPSTAALDLPAPAAAAPPPHGDAPQHCIAIGLATQAFRALHRRMPGWDSQSIGYHSDDGGLFHGHGAMLRPYGPTFGVGDTVGCGIDYDSHRVFFTLNGKHLGDAMQVPFDFLNGRDIYPIVGLDSNALVECNFTGPFQYDLQAKIQEQHEQVHQILKDAHFPGLDTWGGAPTERDLASTLIA